MLNSPVNETIFIFYFILKFFILSYVPIMKYFVLTNLWVIIICSNICLYRRNSNDIRSVCDNILTCLHQIGMIKAL